MKKILVPTDFSELGDFAYGVAHILAAGLKAEIIALSIISGPQGAIYDESGNLTNDEGNDYSEWTRRLAMNREKMRSWIEDKGDITDTIVTIGNVDQSILQISESQGVDLIIMGTKGLYNKTIWTKGSHTEFVSNHSSIPVLSLKCDRRQLDLEEILLVSDFLEMEKLDLSILKSVQKAYGSKFVLLKINTESQHRTDDQIKSDMEKFAQINELDNYTMKLYKSESVESGIAKFSQEQDIDLIALGTHQGHGFSKLFNGSISDDLINHLYHPILTFPLN
ncbi:MAG: universal stress protein [Saprospiraceae bacterium]|nr:universal stress protein [Saprospiraceae bacterium]